MLEAGAEAEAGCEFGGAALWCWTGGGVGVVDWGCWEAWFGWDSAGFEVALWAGGVVCGGVDGGGCGFDCGWAGGWAATGDGGGFAAGGCAGGIGEAIPVTFARACASPLSFGRPP